MMKILHYGLTNNLGGIESYLYKLSENIDKNKYTFDFLILGSEKPCFYDQLKEMGFGFHFVTERKENPIKNYREIVNVIKNNNYDAVHCHLNSLSYITPAIISLGLGIPTIVHSRNAGIPKSAISRLLHFINSKRIKNKKIIKVAVSDYAGEWMFGKKSTFQIINNGIDIDKFKFKKPERAKIREELGLLNDELIFVHTGALRKQKNHMFLLEIYNEINNNLENTKLLLVGKGLLENEIRKKITDLKIQDNVILMGQRDDIPDILSASDVYIFPSFYEGFPNSVIEAETNGLPCIITDTITKDVVINPNVKQMSLEQSPLEWAVMAQNLTSEKIDRLKASENVQKNGFSVEDEIKKIEKLYRIPITERKY